MSSSASTDPFDVSFENLPINEQLSAYKTWLDSNESHPLRHMIEGMKKLLECNNELEEDKKKLEEDKKKLLECNNELEEDK